MLKSAARLLVSCSDLVNGDTVEIRFSRYDGVKLNEAWVAATFIEFDEDDRGSYIVFRLTDADRAKWGSTNTVSIGSGRYRLPQMAATLVPTIEPVAAYV